MNKLPSFKYKGMIFHNVKDNLFQTTRFGNKLILEYKNNEYHLIKDERLSPVIGIDEITPNINSIFYNDYNW